MVAKEQNLYRANLGKGTKKGQVAIGILGFDGF